MNINAPHKIMFKYVLPISSGILLLTCIIGILRGVTVNNFVISTLGILGAIYAVSTIHWASFEDWKNSQERTSNKKSVPK